MLYPLRFLFSIGMNFVFFRARHIVGTKKEINNKLPRPDGGRLCGPPGLQLAYVFFCLVYFSLYNYFYTTATSAGSVARRTETSSKALAMDNPPNANIHTIVKAQIVFLLSTLTEDNFDRNQIEIRSVSVRCS